MLKIQDAVAVITGGGSGIGRALGEFWLRQGGKVVIADIAEEPCCVPRRNCDRSAAK